jgi:hypothetical protein
MKPTHPISAKPSKPATLRFRRDGRVDFRPRNQRSWIKGLSELNPQQYLALPHRIRRRVVLVEFLQGKSLVSGNSLTVIKH